MFYGTRPPAVGKTTLMFSTNVNVLSVSECHYGECRDYLKVVLNVIRLSVVAPIKQNLT